MVIRINGVPVFPVDDNPIIELDANNGEHYVIKQAIDGSLLIAVTTKPFSTVAVLPQSGNAVRVRGE